VIEGSGSRSVPVPLTTNGSGSRRLKTYGSGSATLLATIIKHLKKLPKSVMLCPVKCGKRVNLVLQKIIRIEYYQREAKSYAGQVVCVLPIYGIAGLSRLALL
jgi:hypothetical protein